jgi:hypothetical protein
LKQDIGLNQANSEEKAVTVTAETTGENVSTLNSDRLLNLVWTLYKNKRPENNFMRPFETALPDSCRLFFISENEFIYPEKFSLISAADIWHVARLDRSGIFRRKIKIIEDGHEYEAVLYTIHLGENISGFEIAAGILQISHAGPGSNCEHRLYALLGSLKRCYTEFLDSSVLKNFIRNKSAFQYVVNVATNEIIASTLPPDGRLVIYPGIAAIQMFDRLKIQNAETDNERGNIKIANCTIMGNNYSVVSINQPRDKANAEITSAPMTGDIFIEIREQIRTIMEATNQLYLQKGQFVDEDHISLIDRIHLSADSLNRLIYQAGQQDEHLNQAQLSEFISRDFDSRIDILPGSERNNRIRDKGKLVSAKK